MQLPDPPILIADKAFLIKFLTEFHTYKHPHITNLRVLSDTMISVMDKSGLCNSEVKKILSNGTVLYELLRSIKKGNYQLTMTNRLTGLNPDELINCLVGLIKIAYYDSLTILEQNINHPLKGFWSEEVLKGDVNISNTMLNKIAARVLCIMVNKYRQYIEMNFKYGNLQLIDYADQLESKYYTSDLFEPIIIEMPAKKKIETCRNSVHIAGIVI